MAAVAGFGLPDRFCATNARTFGSLRLVIKLVDQGFKGKIYCSGLTKEIAELIILDSCKIQEEEAEKVNKEKYSKHVVAEALYDAE